MDPFISCSSLLIFLLNSVGKLVGRNYTCKEIHFYQEAPQLVLHGLKADLILAQLLPGPGYVLQRVIKNGAHTRGAVVHGNEIIILKVNKHVLMIRQKMFPPAALHWALFPVAGSNK